MSQTTHILKQYAYIRKYVIYAFLIFTVATIFGYTTAVFQTDEAMLIFEELIANVSDIGTIGPVTLFLIIFFNNTIKTFFMVLLGSFFGIAPLLMLVANGYVLGIVSYLIAQEYNVTTVLLGIIPHGIVEIPLLIIAGAYGLWLGDMFVQKMRFKMPLRHSYRIIMRMFARFFIPLFFVAAFIEVYVTDMFLTLATNI